MLQFIEPQWTMTPRRWQGEAFKAVSDHLAGEDTSPAIVSAIMGAGKSLLIEELCAAVDLERGDVVVVSTPTRHLTRVLFKGIARRCRMQRHVGIWYTDHKRLGDVVVCCLPSLRVLAEELQARGRQVALWVADELHRCECPTVLAAYPILSPAHALGVTATPFRAGETETIRLFETSLYRYGVGDAVQDGAVVPWRIVHATDIRPLDDTCIAWAKKADGPGLTNAIDIADAKVFAAQLSQAGIPARAVHSLNATQDNVKTLADLKASRLKCVVHVNMLAEGADFPWLRWLILRREVDSRVRFIQEVGRALRSHPGKTEAVFYDPHDLFGGFKLTYAEALGESLDPPEHENPIEKLGLAAERIREADEPVALAWIESVVRSLVVAADAAGMLVGRRTLKKIDRLKPSTALQRVTLRGAADQAEGLSPVNWTECLRAIGGRPECLRFGFAADLIAALDGICRAGWWPQFGEVQAHGVELIGDKQLRFRAVV